jgi:hypothetical protein
VTTEASRDLDQRTTSARGPPRPDSSLNHGPGLGGAGGGGTVACDEMATCMVTCGGSTPCDVSCGGGSTATCSGDNCQMNGC